MRIEFGEWLPDQTDLENPGCVEAHNVVPRVAGFGQLRDLKAFTGALNSACLGAAWFSDLSGNAVNFAGTADRLYKHNSVTTAWDNVSRSATYSTAVSWNFEKFGARVVAVDIGNSTQYYDMGSSTIFANLSGAPSARYIATIRDFLVLANISSYPNRVQWCGFNNTALWTPSLATQAGYQDLLGAGGDIQGIVPGEYGTIFQELSIWRMSYVGPPTIWRLDEVERGRGTPSPKSICYYGSNVFYYDWAGFHAFDGQTSTPIGHERVDKWFGDNCGDVLTIQGAVDRANGLILWGFKSAASSPYNDRLLIFNFRVNRWSWGEVTTQWLSEKRAAALTLDQLDVPLPLGVDLNSIAMDSRAFSSDINMQAFNGSGVACTFEGDPLPASLETKELAFDNHYADTNACLPLVDGADTVRVMFGRRSRQTESVTYSNQISLNRIGEACKVVSAKFQRFRLEITGGFDYARGVEIRGRQAGRR